MFILTVFILIILSVLVYCFIQGYCIVNNESHTMQELSLPLECLLNRGLDGGTLILSVKKSTEFLQFTKYILREGHYGIQMDFPNAPWSTCYFKTLHDYLAENRIDFEFIKATTSQELDFISIDFKRDVDVACQVCSYISKNIFEFTKSTRFKAEYERISPWNEIITSRNPELITIKEGMKTWKKKNKTEKEKSKP
ncbi:MAG: hypothetical protein MJK04_08840 [Psychrosphaera sp.]|nr:hypothetical protein [Psychrosphaera sp.]